MRTLRPMALPRWLIAGAMPFMFLFMSVMPAAAATPGSIIATKDCAPRLVRPGDTVRCTITITNLGTAAKAVRVTDILAGGGLYPDTTLGEIIPCQIPLAPDSNQLNRQQYRLADFNGICGDTFTLAPLSTTVVGMIVVPFRTRALCINSFYANLVNEVHIDLGSAVGTHIATARATFSVSCNAPRTPD